MSDPVPQRPTDGAITGTGAGGDLYAAALVDSPYNIISGVAPDDTIPHVFRTMQQLQRRGLTPEEDLAFRSLRDLASRLVWDLRTLGTSPSVDAGEWHDTRILLTPTARARAEQRWPIPTGRANTETALHVRAVLVANELAYEAHAHLQASDAALRRYVAYWVALLWRENWLLAFAAHRCRVWRGAPPDAGDRAQFLEKARKAALHLLEIGVGPDERRLAIWSANWERERSAIEMISKASGKEQVPPCWSAGFGGLGLDELGETPAVRQWLLKRLRPDHLPLPLSALRDGKASFSHSRPEVVATAAVAVQWILSGLGHAAADVWMRQGRSAWSRLRAFAGQDDAPGDLLTAGWFGTGAVARRRITGAVAELSAEALLLQLQEELARPDVDADQVCETSGRVLYHANGVLQPQVVIDQMEELACGRVLACTEGRRPTDPNEVDRVLEVGLQLRAMLLGRGAGQRLSNDLAQLFRLRAVAAWNRQRGLARPAVQARILRDLFMAADLAPHNADIVTSLGQVVLQTHSGATSRAEQRGLLQKAFDYLSIAQAMGITSPDLEEVRGRLLERLDPEAARTDALKRLDEALRTARHSSTSGGTT